MSKLFKFALLSLAVVATTACGPTDKVERGQWLATEISRTTTEICLKGNKYLYLSAGNTSQVINIWDKNGKVIPCEEGGQQ